LHSDSTATQAPRNNNDGAEPLHGGDKAQDIHASGGDDDILHGNNGEATQPSHGNDVVTQATRDDKKKGTRQRGEEIRRLRDRYMKCGNIVEVLAHEQLEPYGLAWLSLDTAQTSLAPAW